jgi:hypothetical protein
MGVAMNPWRDALVQSVIAATFVAVHLAIVFEVPILAVAAALCLTFVVSGTAHYRFSRRLPSPERPLNSRTAVVMRGPRFTLWQLAVTIALIAVLFAIVVQLEISPVVVVGCVVVVAIGAALYWFSRLPLRVRLAVELSVVCALLTFCAWGRRPGFYVAQSIRAGKLSEDIAARAATVQDPVKKARMQHEAAWFARVAFVMGWKAWWLGLMGGSSNQRGEPLNDSELVFQLGILGEMDRHEAAAN